MIDPRSPEWPRQQVARMIRERILSGEWTRQLPPQMALADEFNVSPKTIEKALDILKAEGLIYGVAGRGVFIHDDCE